MERKMSDRDIQLTAVDAVFKADTTRSVDDESGGQRVLPVEQQRSETIEQKVALTDGRVMLGVMTGDAIPALQELPANTFNVAVTSPPYYWARDYEIDGQIGHEDTAEEYVRKLVETFQEVRRVLHPEGVFYLNIGDTYYSGNGQPHGSDPRSPSRNFMRTKMRAVDRSGWNIPKKSMIGIPWRVAFAMQGAGWTLRSDIIWNRCNAFTEPTALDRPYRQYEHVFLFTKTRFYSYDRTQLPEEDVWNIAIERSKRMDHNAPFPKELVRRCVLTGSPVGGFVLDPFSGSGTTLEVAMELGRHAVGIDLNGKYTQELTKHLHKRACHQVNWDALMKTLSTPPEAWESWKGNRRNYRKPGTPKVRSSAEFETGIPRETNDEILHTRSHTAGD